MPGNGNIQFPFPAHIVIGDEALAAILFPQRVGSLETYLHGRQVDAIREADVFGKGLLSHRVGGVEKGAIVDLVLTKNFDPTKRVHVNR